LAAHPEVSETGLEIPGAQIQSLNPAFVLVTILRKLRYRAGFPRPQTRAIECKKKKRILLKSN